MKNYVVWSMRHPRALHEDIVLSDNLCGEHNVNFLPMEWIPEPSVLE